MAHTLRLSTDADELKRLMHALDASVNVLILRELARARKKGDGWLYLTQIAQRIDQAPGTVGIAIEKLGPFIEEKRERGLRYFRATVTDVTLTLERRAKGSARE